MGSYEFNGLLDSFKETIDFFSDSGVALRALVSITLSQQDAVFDDSANLSQPGASATLIPASAGTNLQNLTSNGGDPSATRQLAGTMASRVRVSPTDRLWRSTSRHSSMVPSRLSALRQARQQGLEYRLRIGRQSAHRRDSASALVRALESGCSAGIGIGGGAAAGFGVGASAGIGGGLSFGAGASAGISAGAGAGVSIGGGALFGSKASAGVSASAGAFAGLEVGRATVSTTAQLNPLKMLPATVGADVSTGAGASFSLGGAAQSSASAGLSADVGASVRFSDRLTFSSE